MKEALLRLGDTISAPVYLHKLGKIALIIYGLAPKCPEVADLHSHSDRSREQMRIEFCSEGVSIVE